MNRFYRGRRGLLGALSDLDITIDDEMWHSITPELIAKEHSRLFDSFIKTGLILDPFCGYGTDILYQGRGLIAIGCDIVLERLITARRIHESIGKGPADFVCADFIRGKSCFRKGELFDIVYLSPPWGHCGIRNRKHEPGAFGSRQLQQLTVDGLKVFEHALRMVRSDNIVYYLPRGMAESELIRLATLTNNSLNLSAQVHYSYDPNDETTPKDRQLRVRGVTVFFGNLSRHFIEHS